MKAVPAPGVLAFPSFADAYDAGNRFVDWVAADHKRLTVLFFVTLAVHFFYRPSYSSYCWHP